MLDPNRIDQVLNNLLSNAIKYSPGGGTITISAWRGPTELGFDVRDNGMGMSEEDTARIFTKFFRSGEVRRSAIPGVGLGMSIAREIVEGHGGDISCISVPGSGTTFTVTLPVTPADVSVLV
jgi:signal transduction histidine kinase